MMNVGLTKEPASITDLEEIVRALVSFGADEGTLRGATFMVGAYLGEILRKVLGGSWVSTKDDLLVLEVGGTLYTPIEKAREFAAAPENTDGLSFFASAVLARHA